MTGTLQDIVAGMAARGTDEALVAMENGVARRWSYADLHREAMALAAGLSAALGPAPGRVAVVSPNSAELVRVRLALVVAGIEAVPLDDAGIATDVADALADSGARTLITTVALVYDLLPACRPHLDRVWLLDGDRPDAPSIGTLASDEGSSAFEPPPVQSDAITAIIYTSGTTGRAKGVPLTHGNFLVNVEALARDGYIDGNDRVLLPLPLHHAYPFMVGLMVTLSCGATLVLPEGLSGPEIVKTLQDERIATMVGVPRLYEAMVDGIRGRLQGGGAITRLVFGNLLKLSVLLRRKAGLKSGRVLMAPVRKRVAPDLRLIASGGAKLDPEACWMLEGLGFDVRTGYGLVETSSVSTYNRKDDPRIGTEGRPVAGTEIRIDTPDAEGVGEIHLRGPHVFAGYLGDPETSAEVFTDDKWFKTGDLGYLEDDGSVVVVGRSKEVIVLGGGKNVGPEEVEDVLNESAYIKEASVLEKNGDLVALVVPDMAGLKDAPSARHDQLIRVEIAARCNALAPYKRVSGFRLWRGDLPRTRLGKLRRFQIAELYDQAAAGASGPEKTDEERAADAALMQGTAAQAVVDVLSRRAPNVEITPDTSPQLDLGVDSLAWVEIAVELESRLGIELSPDAVGEIVTVRDLIGAVEAAPESTGTVSRDVTAPKPPGLGLRLLGVVLYWINRLIVRTLFRMRIEGTPPTGGRGRMVMANHVSDLDPFVMAAALPYSAMREFWWGADVSRLFTSAFRRAFARASKVFPVDDSRPAETLARAEAVLARGDGLIWFPESWRSPDGKVQEFTAGIGVLLTNHRPVVTPALIVGTFEALPRHRTSLKLVPVTVRFGADVDAGRLIGAEQVQTVAAARTALLALDRG